MYQTRSATKSPARSARSKGKLAQDSLLDISMVSASPTVNDSIAEIS